MTTRENRFAEEKSKDAEEKTPLAALPRMLAKGFSKAAGVFFTDAKEFCKAAKFPGKPASNVRMLTANGMRLGKNVRKHAEEFPKGTKDGRMHAKEFSKVGKKLRITAKCPGKLANFLRRVGKVFRKPEDVFSQEGSAAPMLAESRFKLAFFPRNMHEEKSKDVFSIGKLHPTAILHTFCGFVLKQRACVRNPATAAYKDDSGQRTAVAGREGNMARHPETCDSRILRRVRLTG